MKARSRAARCRAASPFSRLLIAACLSTASSFVFAAGNVGMWRYCLPTPRVTVPAPLADDGSVQFTADAAEAQGDQYRLQGNVFGQRGSDGLYADQINYNAASDTAEAEGNVRYLSGEQLLRGSQASMKLGDDTGEMAGASFWLQDRHLRGRADMLYLDGPKQMRLQTSLFTTCDEGNEFWRLRAASLRLNQAENIGVAYHVRLELMKVPVFYSPYLSFPLQGRKSGLLFPSYGDTSRSGKEFSQPWYFNIAPDKDATLTPTYLSLRGMQWGGEFRYLNERSRGTLQLSYLPNDKLYGEDRGAIAFNHSGDPAPGWRTNLKLNRVSDDEYLTDFGKQLNTTSVTYLESRADVSYLNSHWNAAVLAQNYQTLDDLRPLTYSRMPQVKLGMTPLRVWRGLELDARAEVVRFDRESDAFISNPVIGSRIDIQPAISLPMETSAGFLTPRLSFRHTRYSLQRTALGSDANPTRNLPIASIDSGLFFERELSGSSGATTQTLEPRLFYLYVPYVDQSSLIVDESGVSRVFDSSQPLLSIGQMFRDNRFNGADRVGDANQLSAALTTRFLDSGGRELASATLGRIFYFRDRKVTLLAGAPVQTQVASNWLGQVNTRWLSSLGSRVTLEWNPFDNTIDRGNVSVRYHPRPRAAINVGYRFERTRTAAVEYTRLEQSEISAMWPVWKGLSVMGLRRYSVLDGLALESIAGVEYESCCWTFRLVKRNYRIRADETMSASLWIQLELKGLSSVGRNVAALLERDILAP